jgi:hypothetical protein
MFTGVEIAIMGMAGRWEHRPLTAKTGVRVP